jgi:hypothetical protein
MVKSCSRVLHENFSRVLWNYCGKKLVSMKIHGNSWKFCYFPEFFQSNSGKSTDGRFGTDSIDLIFVLLGYIMIYIICILLCEGLVVNDIMNAGM